MLYQFIIENTKQINMSPKVLKPEAYAAITGNNQLMADIATVLGVSLLSLPMMLQRKSKRFTELPAITLIAKAMACRPDELLIDAEAKLPA